MEMYILYNKKVCECFASTQKLLFFEQTYDAQKTCARRRNFMKRKNLLLLFVVAMLAIASTFTGCGNVDGTNDGNTNGQENTTNDNNGEMELTIREQIPIITMVALRTKTVTQLVTIP